MPTETNTRVRAEDGRHIQRDVFPAVSLSPLRDIRLPEYLTRFALGAAVSVVAAVIAKIAGARFGGMFLAFPAILPASLTLLEEREGTRRASRDAVGAALGGVALIVFAGIGEFTFGQLPAALALCLALAGWLAAAFLLYAVLAALRPDDCDRNQD